MKLKRFQMNNKNNSCCVGFKKDIGTTDGMVKTYSRIIYKSY